MKAHVLVLLLLGVTQGKDHLVVSNSRPHEEPHLMVGNTPQEIEECLFQLKKPKVNAYDADEYDQLCLKYKGGWSIGFQWDQSTQEFDRTNKLGLYQLGYQWYSKMSLKLNPIFTMNRLFDTNMVLEVNEFKFFHLTQFAYYTYTNDLCLDIVSEVDNFSIKSTMELKIIQCAKTLIDCFDDFGQFFQGDIPTSEKPISPYAKLFDECTLGVDEPVTLKEWKPLEYISADGSTKEYQRSIRWVGSGSNNIYCFPGNVVRMIYIATKKVAGSPIVQESMNGDYGDNWIGNVVDPMLRMYSKTIFEWLQKQAQEFEPDQEDGSKQFYKY